MRTLNLEEETSGQILRISMTIAKRRKKEMFKNNILQIPIILRIRNMFNMLSTLTISKWMPHSLLSSQVLVEDKHQRAHQKFMNSLMNLRDALYEDRNNSILLNFCVFSSRFCCKTEK